MTNIINLLEARRAKLESLKAETSDRGVNEGGVQLALPFLTSELLYMVDVRNFVSQDDFQNFCAALVPSAVVDLRVAPRLDFIRPNRKQAFDLFNAFGFEYTDVLGRLKLSSYDVLDLDVEGIVSSISRIHSINNKSTPIVALIDNFVFAQKCLVRLSELFDASILDREAARRLMIEGSRQQM